MSLELSKVAPDYADLFAQLQASLQQTDSWRDLLTTSTGTTLLSAISAVGALDQYAIESGVQEAFLRTAKLDSSIYANVADRGVRIPRKTPAQCTASLILNNTGTTPIVLAPYTQFTANQVSLFNRVSITFPPGQSTQVVSLYEGIVVTENYTGSGLDYQVYISSNGGFIISDLDVVVTMNVVTTLPRVYDGLWNYPNQAAVLDTTNDQGALVLIFGGGGYGTAPASGSALKLTYVVTQGAASTNLSFTGATLATSSLPNMQGGATTSLANGGNELAASVYRVLGPQLYAANNREVTTADHQAIALTYTGIQDTFCQGQRYYAPNDVTYSNVVRVSALTHTSMDSTAWTNFTNFLYAKAMMCEHFLRYDPTPYVVNITADVYCNSSANLTAMQSTLITNFTSLMAPRPGVLGSTLNKTDIYAVFRAQPDIVYTDLWGPTTDIFTIVNITNSGFTGTGTTPSGVSLQYYLTATTSVGETIGNYFAIQTPTSGNVNFTWVNPAVNLVTGYKIYKSQTPVTISTITYSTITATLTTSAPHNLTTGQYVTISGATPSAYNGPVFVTVTGANTFTYTMGSNPGSNASPVGAYTITNPVFKLLTSLASSAVSYSDVPTTNATGAIMPKVDTSGVFYASVGTVTLNMLYTTPTVFTPSNGG